MATGKQNRDFEESVFEEIKLLDKAIEWIKANMPVEQVFDKDELCEWVGDHSKPEDVFAEEDLEAWAAANGFVKEAP